MSTITLWLAFYFVLFSEYTFLLLLVTLLQVEYKIEYEYFILGFFFKRVFMFITFGVFLEERGRERKYKVINLFLLKLGAVCCLKRELAFTTSLKQFVLTKSTCMCWLAFERKTKNIMLCALPLCFQLVIFEKLLYNTNKIINTGTIFVLSSFMQ